MLFLPLGDKLRQLAFYVVFELLSLVERIEDVENTTHLFGDAHDTGPETAMRIARSIIEALCCLDDVIIEWLSEVSEELARLC